MKRLRPFAGSIGRPNPAPIADRPNALDVWLLRLGQISQLGLFIITVGALYFTVIPLYQKALLDEAIARKELELKAANASVDKAYKQIRSLVVHGFIFNTGAKCSGLLLPPETMQESSSIGHDNTALGIVATDCLSESLSQATSIKELRKADQTFLEDRISRIAAKLESTRRKAIIEYDSAPSAVSQHPGKLVISPGAPGRLLEFTLRSVSPEERARLVESALLSQKRREIENGYGAAVRDAILQLHKLEWPEADAGK